MSNNTKAFTLVELAIVMTIIGLLIGGILKGQAMLENARITAHISQIKSFEAVTTTFRDNYSSMPGDFSRATTRLPNCVTATNNCRNGDGNGLVGAAHSHIGNRFSVTSSNLENVQFWKHLALADLISGINIGRNTSLQFGQSQPSSKYGGGFNLVYSVTSYNGSGGHFLFTSNDPRDTATWAPPLGRAVFSPSTAAIIDAKTDDGIALSGYTQAISNSVGPEGCGGISATRPRGYEETIKKKNCEMFYKIQG